MNFKNSQTRNIEKSFNVIIPSKKFDKNLIFCIKNISKFYKNIKILLVLDILSKNKIKFKNIEIIKSVDRNIGSKRNLAARNSKSKFLCFIDSDAFPTIPWLDYHYKNLIKYHISGGPNISYTKNNESKKIVSKARLLNFVTYDPDIKKRFFKKKFVKFLPACNFCIRKETYLKMGGMAENLFTNEELVLMEKLKKNKIKILLDSRPYVFHNERNIKKFFHQRLNYGSSLLYNFIRYPNFTSFLGLISLTPIFLMFSFLLIPVSIYVYYFFLIQISVILILAIYFANKINKNSSFSKSLLVIMICIYGTGLGFIWSLINHRQLKKFYIQS